MKIHYLCPHHFNVKLFQVAKVYSNNLCLFSGNFGRADLAGWFYIFNFSCRNDLALCTCFCFHFFHYATTNDALKTILSIVARIIKANKGSLANRLVWPHSRSTVKQSQLNIHFCQNIWSLKILFWLNSWQGPDYKRF